MSEESLNPQDIFFQASQLEPDARDVYLSEACKENDELRREVEALLEALEGAGSFLDSPIVDRIRKTVVQDGSTYDAESEDGKGTIWVVPQK